MATSVSESRLPVKDRRDRKIRALRRDEIVGGLLLPRRGDVGRPPPERRATRTRGVLFGLARFKPRRASFPALAPGRCGRVDDSGLRENARVRSQLMVVSPKDPIGLVGDPPDTVRYDKVAVRDGHRDG